MSNKRITDLSELTNPTTDDVFPVVDIATNTTTKVQLGNLPVPTSVTTALATKENTITPGTTAQYFRGDKSFQTLDKTAVGLANVDNTSDANKPVSTAQQTALNAKQDTLVSGTNIKTLNSTSLLGSGNIVLTANPSGVSGAIQFSNGSAFASDASNLFWDDTNNRLGVGTNAPTATIHIKGAGNSSATNALYLENSDSSQLLKVTNNGILSLGLNFPKIAGSNVIGGFSGGFNCVYNNGAFFSVAENGVPTMVMDSSFQVGIGTSTPTARTHIKGSGSTSATTSLLVQNSAGQMALQVTDDKIVSIAGRLYLDGAFDQIYTQSSAQIRVQGYHGMQIFRGTGVTSTMFEVFDNATTTGGLLFNIKNTPFANMLCVNHLGQMAMGTASPNASAQMQIDSTTRGFLPPRMTTTQKNNISSPATGLVVYDTTTNKLQCYNGSTWNDLF
jgi:hypothetical protein